mmetsp:Transcript_70676/g.111894  ORF Transcript_70676/g.111894 Transcript_70676/m.111894 type:complete len:207 (+) Transcript_70676:156-776(+)
MAFLPSLQIDLRRSPRRVMLQPGWLLAVGLPSICWMSGQVRTGDPCWPWTSRRRSRTPTRRSPAPWRWRPPRCSPGPRRHARPPTAVERRGRRAKAEKAETGPPWRPQRRGCGRRQQTGQRRANLQPRPPSGVRRSRLGPRLWRPWQAPIQASPSRARWRPSGKRGKQAATSTRAGRRRGRPRPGQRPKPGSRRTRCGARWLQQRL